MSTWIKLQRGIRDHWISKDAEKFQRWVFMIMEVNYAETKMPIGNELYTIPKGSSANSLRTWSGIFGCSTKSVTSFFNMLEKDGMITRKIIGKGKHSTTLVIIENYDKYQVDEKHKGNSNGNINDHANGIQNNNSRSIEIKKDRKVNNNPLLCSLSKESELLSDVNNKMAYSFFMLIKKNILESGVAKTTILDKAKLIPWANEIRLMRDADGRTIEEIRKVYEFLKTPTYWKKNILSTKKLRIQFERLYLEINQKPKINGGEQFDPEKLREELKSEGFNV